VRPPIALLCRFIPAMGWAAILDRVLWRDNLFRTLAPGVHRCLAPARRPGAGQATGASDLFAPTQSPVPLGGKSGADPAHRALRRWSIRDREDSFDVRSAHASTRVMATRGWACAPTRLLGRL